MKLLFASLLFLTSLSWGSSIRSPMGVAASGGTLNGDLYMNGQSTWTASSGNFATNGDLHIKGTVYGGNGNELWLSAVDYINIKHGTLKLTGDTGDQISNIAGNINNKANGAVDWYLNGGVMRFQNAGGENLFIINKSSTSIGGHLFCSGLSSAGSGTALVISATNEIIPQTSSIRFKKNVKNLSVNTGVLEKLRPVEFDYKSDGIHSYGLIAEEVVKELPAIVNKDKNGNPFSISYDEIIPILIKKINELEARVKVLEKK